MGICVRCAFFEFWFKVSALESTVLQKVDSQSIYQQLSFRQSFKSKKYRDGMIENYFVVETSGVADLRKIGKFVLFLIIMNYILLHH